MIRFVLVLLLGSFFVQPVSFEWRPFPTNDSAQSQAGYVTVLCPDCREWWPGDWQNQTVYVYYRVLRPDGTLDWVNNYGVRGGREIGGLPAFITPWYLFPDTVLNEAGCVVLHDVEAHVYAFENPADMHVLQAVTDMEVCRTYAVFLTPVFQ